MYLGRYMYVRVSIVDHSVRLSVDKVVVFRLKRRGQKQNQHN